MKRKRSWSSMDVSMKELEMGRSSVELSLGKVKKPSASWQSIMQRRAACLEDGVPNRMMAAIRIYRNQTERVQTLPEPRTGGRMLKDIPGLLLDTGYTGVREPLSFSEIPFLYEEQRLSGKGLQDFRNKIIYYESSRGCPFRCSYCLSSIDKTLRLRDVNRVLPELQFFLDCKVPQVKFIDRTFNCNRRMP